MKLQAFPAAGISDVIFDLVGGNRLIAQSHAPPRIAAPAWQSGWDDEAARNCAESVARPETAIARPYRQLTQSLDASIGYNRALYLFRVENRDAFPWTHCRLSLNSHGISGYDLEVESIKPGLTDAALLQSAELVDAEGKKFDATTTQVATLDLEC